LKKKAECEIQVGAGGPKKLTSFLDFWNWGMLHDACIDRVQKDKVVNPKSEHSYT
jgi:hypothetical protein